MYKSIWALFVKFCMILVIGLLPQFIYAALVVGNTGNTQVVRVINYNSNQATNMDYFTSLLELALQQSEAKYGPYQLQRVDAVYTQERMLRLLGQGIVLDVMNTMTSAYREQNYLAVPVPLLGGLLGKRMLLVRADRKLEFEAIQQGSELKRKVACQGMTWPDSDILEQNGFVVARVINFESMLEMLEKGRCDYIPRGINEVFNEMGIYQNRFGAIALVDNILLSYPAPIYFFVSKTNPQLAERITYGLTQMHQQKSLYPFLKQHAMVKAVFPLQQWDGLRVCQLQHKGIAKVTKGHFPWFEVGKKSLGCEPL